MATKGTDMHARSAGEKHVTVSPDTEMARELAQDRASGEDRIPRLPNPSRPARSRPTQGAGRKAVSCR